MNLKLFSFAATMTLLADIALAGTEMCSGTLTGFYYNDLKVDEDTSCTLDGAEVHGNIEVKEGAMLAMTGSEAKKISMKEGSQAVITDTGLRDGIDADKVSRLAITGQTVIGGDVKVKLEPTYAANGEFSVIGGDVTIKGEVKVESSTGGAVSLLDVAIMGGIEIKDSVLDYIMVVGNNLMDDDGKPKELKIEKVMVTDKTMTGGYDEDSYSASTYVEANVNVKELVIKYTMNCFDLIVKENEVEKKLSSKQNSFRFAKFLDNCASEESVIVEKSYGDGLTCIGNNLASQGCHGQQGVRVADNVVGAYPGDVQCNPCPPHFPPGYMPCGEDCASEVTVLPTPEHPFPVCACEDSCGDCGEFEFCGCERFGDGSHAFCQCIPVLPENPCEPLCFNCVCFDEEETICACQDVCEDERPCSEDGGVGSENCQCDFFDEDFSCKCIA